MRKKLNLAVVGATGVVGRAIIEILEQRKFPVGDMHLLASHRSAGELIDFNQKPIMVEMLETFDFSKVDVALFSAGSAVSQKYAPLAADAGCIVIDNTSCFRYDPEVPLVVSEVNPEAISDYKARNIIANPNCSTMQLMVVLKPIYDAVGIERINITTYQSVSGAGKQALEDLVLQTSAFLNGRSYDSTLFPSKIAFNVIPHIDEFLDNGYTKEEMKIVWETQKILHDPAIAVNATAVRVPVFYGHSEAVHLETKKKITAEEASAILAKAEGIKLIDSRKTGGYPTPVSHASGKDYVFVGRIREDISHPRGLNMWVVSDNIRKGAALNAVQIAEILLKKYL